MVKKNLHLALKGGELTVYKHNKEMAETFEVGKMYFTHIEGYDISANVSLYDYASEGVSIFDEVGEIVRCQLTSLQQPMIPHIEDMRIELPDDSVEGMQSIDIKNREGITYEELFKAISSGLINIDTMDHRYYEGFSYTENNTFRICLGS